MPRRWWRWPTRHGPAGWTSTRPVVVSSAETLAAHDRTAIADSFGATVREVYGSSEVLHAAFECPQGTLHVSEDRALLEPVDDRHQPVPPGTASQTVLVTNFANRVQPIIRYDLGDAVTVVPEPCACGSPLMGIRPQGRCDDVLALPARGGGVVTVLPLALSTVIEETPGVEVGQAVHVPPDRLVIRCSTDDRPRAEVAAALDGRLAAWLATQGVADVAIEHDDAPPSRDPRSGKFRAVSVAKPVAPAT